MGQEMVAGWRGRVGSPACPAHHPHCLLPCRPALLKPHCRLTPIATPSNQPLQVLSLDLVTANGTVLTLTPESNPHLFRAAAVSVGRLGVVTQLKLRIKPQMAVSKSLQVG